MISPLLEMILAMSSCVHGNYSQSTIVMGVEDSVGTGVGDSVDHLSMSAWQLTLRSSLCDNQAALTVV